MIVGMYGFASDQRRLYEQYQPTPEQQTMSAAATGGKGAGKGARQPVNSIPVVKRESGKGAGKGYVKQEDPVYQGEVASKTEKSEKVWQI